MASTVLDSSTGNFLTFVKRTAIAYGPRISKAPAILVICNGSPFAKVRKLRVRVTGEYRVRGLCSAASGSDFLTDLVGRISMIRYPHKVHPVKE